MFYKSRYCKNISYKVADLHQWSKALKNTCPKPFPKIWQGFELKCRAATLKEHISVAASKTIICPEHFTKENAVALLQHTV